MKKYLFVIAAAALLTACGSTKPVADPYQDRAQVERTAQTRYTEQAIAKSPEWMSKLPKSANAVYENGTATSPDFAMADLMAKTIAYTKICVAAGGKVRSQTKMYGTQDGVSMEMTVRSICPDVDITGVETVEMVHVAEGTRIRTYVLVALPIGDANTMRKEADARRDRKTESERKERAFKELDERVDGKTAEPEKPAVTGGITLMNVDNAEYKAKRDAALQKEGAVIGQSVVR
jgi:hypothetical protein